VIVDLRRFNLVDISIITNDQLNIMMQDTNEPNPDVWAIGDASTIEEAPLPATAQGTRFLDDCLPSSNYVPVASQKARYLTTKLNTLAKDKGHSKPFEFHNQGSLAYIGNWLVNHYLMMHRLS
jgi:NADH dehydrogenase FAD-containing subunit